MQYLLQPLSLQQVLRMRKIVLVLPIHILPAVVDVWMDKLIQLEAQALVVTIMRATEEYHLLVTLMLHNRLRNP